MAIIGRGDISTAIKDRPGFVFYCNGVSNRKPLTQDAIVKEVTEISNLDKSKMVVYISTLSIYYSTSNYTNHKIKIEEIIRKNYDNYCIVRIGNILWGDNPNTLINSLAHKIFNKLPFEIQDTHRYLITRDEFRHWIAMIPQSGKHEMNLTGRMYSVQEIVKDIKNGNI